MKAIKALTKRNTRLFFKDKGMFFTSLITPVILLVLYMTFLENVYRDSFTVNLPQTAEVSEKLINGCVGGQLFSSLLAVCCVTVPFCSNMLMVQDKVTGARSDLTIAPVKRSTLALGYYLATMATSLIICLVAAGLGLAYIAQAGWYLSGADVGLLLMDVFLLVLFGTALSSIVNFFLSTQGQISAVGTIVSAGYGFICGAYMPISQFGEGLQKALSFLPGTYGTSMLRNHAMEGVFAEMEDIGFPGEVVEGIRDSIDCNLYFFEEQVPLSTMILIVTGTTAALIFIYVALNVAQGRRVH